jgi:hypothetical protein
MKLVFFLTLFLVVAGCHSSKPGVVPVNPGGSEVGNGGDPKYLPAEHGFRYAKYLSSRIDKSHWRYADHPSTSVADVDWFFNLLPALRAALEDGRIEWVPHLPDSCRDETWACYVASAKTIYLARDRAPAGLTFREAASTFLHEAAHAAGESSEAKAILASYLALEAWKDMGHPELPHWVGMADPPNKNETVAEDPLLLHSQYSDWSESRFFVWDELRLQSYDSVANTWEIRPVRDNTLGWKRRTFLPTNLGNSQTSIWLKGNGLVFVPCFIEATGIRGANAVRLEKSSLTWKTVSNHHAPGYRRWASYGKSRDLAVVWGGAACTPTPVAFNDGGLYDPTSDVWTYLPGSLPNTPSPRYSHSLLVEEEKIFVWGGYSVFKSPKVRGQARVVRDGGIFDLQTRTWSSIPEAENSPSPRLSPFLAWTTRELIVFGGRGTFNQQSVSSGALYNPVTRTWRKMADPPPELSYGPYDKVFSFWTGSQMAVMTPMFLAYYDPTEDRWTSFGRLMMAEYEPANRLVWNGFEAILWNPETRRGLRLFQ